MPKRCNLTAKPLYKYKEFWIIILLIAITLPIYWPVQHHQFINYDDDKFVTNNIYVQSGITLKGIRWAFEKGWGYWKPLTWISLMVDYEIYGMNASGFLMTNLFLHLLNTVILFFLLKQMTGELWKSGFVAALFAIHPLHVESVAWVAERKDVLSTFFWFIATLAYVRYTKTPKLSTYLLVVFFMGCGLMAKPMLVTLPATFLLLDYWPLQRIRYRENRLYIKEQAAKSSTSITGNGSRLFSPINRLIIEKIPLFLLSAATSFYLLSLKLKDSYPIVAPLESSSLYSKLSTAIMAYITYLEKTIWPFSLAIPYPVHEISLQQMTFAFIVMIFISILTIINLTKRPYIAVGWFWYIGTLIPVIGIINVGSFSMADRFTYVPLIGIFIIVAWGIPEFLHNKADRRIILAISATLILLLSLTAWNQVTYWENTINLFSHSLKVTNNNYIAHDTLASTLLEKGKPDKAIQHYERVIKIKPNYAGGHNNIGNAYKKLNKIPEAIHHYSEAIRLDNKFTDAYYNLGVVFLEKKKHKAAEQYFRKVIEYNQESFEAYDNLGTALAAQGKDIEAIRYFRTALEIKPNFENALVNLGGVFMKTGNLDQAAESYGNALKINSKRSDVHYNLGILLLQQQNIEEAIKHFKASIQINPDFLQSYVYLGDIFAKAGATDLAIKYLYQTIRIKPNYAEMHYYLGMLFMRQNSSDNAVKHFYQAISVKPNYAAARLGLAKALALKNTKQLKSNNPIK